MISNTGNILMRKMTEAIQKRSLKIAFLGYTDIMLSDAEWRALGVNPRQLADRPNGDLLRSGAYHNRSDVSVTPGLTPAVNAVLHHECNITVFDFVKHEGTEVAWDFNLPIGEQWHQKFDVIIDAGTCEHIFNLPQALSNVYDMVAVDGLVLHGGPLCWPNHGFYGYNPTLFADFYEANDCSVIEIFLEAFRTTEKQGRERVVIANVPNMIDSGWRSSRISRFKFNVSAVIRKGAHRDSVTSDQTHKQFADPV